MKPLFISILILVFALNANAQYNNLDAVTVKKLGLYKIVEWTTSIDSIHNTTDSSCTRLIYNRAGRLAEKDYYFSRDLSEFISVKYSYNDKGFMTDSVEDIPYSVMTQSISEPVSSTESVYDYYGEIKTKTNKWLNGKVEVWNYGYDDQNLLYYIDIKTNVKQGREIRFEYTFLPR
jgi:hypothetical protein